MNVDRVIKLAIYKLKQTFGKSVDIYRLNTISTDFATGNISTAKSRWRVRKAIFLPREMVHKFAYTPTFTVANKNTTEGGYYDVENQTFVFDGRDLPKGFTFQPDDYLVIKNQYKYELVLAGTYGDSNGFIVIARLLRGQVPDIGVAFDMSIHDNLTVGDTNESTVD